MDKIDLNEVKIGDDVPELGKLMDTGAAKETLVNQLTSDLLRDYALHGKEVLEKYRKAYPDKYMATVSNLIPKEMTVKTVEEYSSEEMVEAVREMLGEAAAYETAKKLGVKFVPQIIQEAEENADGED